MLVEREGREEGEVGKEEEVLKEEVPVGVAAVPATREKRRRERGRRKRGGKLRNRGPRGARARARAAAAETGEREENGEEGVTVLFGSREGRRREGQRGEVTPPASCSRGLG